MSEKTDGASLWVKVGPHTGVTWISIYGHTLDKLDNLGLEPGDYHGDITNYDNGLVTYLEINISTLITLGIPVMNCFKPPMHTIVPSL